MRAHWYNIIDKTDVHDLFVDHFTLRHKVFIKGLGWELYSVGGREIDQYDGPNAHYCLVEQDNKLVAGARIIRTSQVMGNVTYMIRDAALGRLSPSLPADICAGFDPATTDDVWEATRLYVDPDLNKQDKKQALTATVHALREFAREQGATTLIALGGVELLIGVKSMGYQISRLTEYHRIGSGKVAIFKMDLDNPFLN